MRWLSEKIEFPPHETATKEGVLALGGRFIPRKVTLCLQEWNFSLVFS